MFSATFPENEGTEFLHDDLFFVVLGKANFAVSSIHQEFIQVTFLVILYINFSIFLVSNAIVRS